MGVAEPRKLDSIRVFISTLDGKSETIFVQPTALIEDFVETLRKDLGADEYSAFVFEGRDLLLCGFFVLFLF